MESKVKVMVALGVAVILFFSLIDISGVTTAQDETGPKHGADDLVMPVSDIELMSKVRQTLSAAGEEPSFIKKISLRELGNVYVTTVHGGQKSIFARVVARRVPCMDCHDVFFVYSFDDSGRFLKFIPLYITKRYNKKWDRDDISKIENRFSGKPISVPVGFNPMVDAVSSATISSKLVFHSMNETHKVYKKLVELGYAPKK